MGGAELLGQGEAVVVDVDRDDNGALGDACGHDRCAAHGADAEDDESRADLRLQLVEHGAGPGVEPAAKRAEVLEGDVRVDLHDGLLDDVRVGPERGLAEEVRGDGLPTRRGEGCASVEAASAEVGGEEVLAVRHLPGAAPLAVAAVGRCEHDMVARLHRGDGVADGLDHARALVPEHGRQGGGVDAVANEAVGVADPRCHHAHPNLVVAEVVELELFDGQWFAGGAGDGGGDLHGVFLRGGAASKARRCDVGQRARRRV